MFQSVLTSYLAQHLLHPLHALSLNDLQFCRIKMQHSVSAGSRLGVTRKSEIWLSLFPRVIRFQSQFRYWNLANTGACVRGLWHCKGNVEGNVEGNIVCVIRKRNSWRCNLKVRSVILWKLWKDFYCLWEKFTWYFDSSYTKWRAIRE